MKWLENVLRMLKRTVAALTGTLLLWMVILSLVQLLLRWFTSTSLTWADLQLRQLVLWVGLLGGVLAASEARHIRIDLVEHLLKGRVKMVVERLISLIAAGMMFYMTRLAYQFLLEEKVAGTMLDRVLFGYPVPIWIIEALIPVCFGLMGFYFLLAVILPPPSTLKSGGTQ